MVNKVKAILGSVRFWLLTVILAGDLASLVMENTLSVSTAMVPLQVWLAAVVALGTLDSVATKFGK